MTSSWNPSCSTGGVEFGAGRLSSRMLVFENTAVKMRKNTRITITSIMGTMLSSWRPRKRA